MRYNWTPQAIDCYKRGCVCEGCSVKYTLDTCKMKQYVLKLVRAIGKPPENSELIDGLGSVATSIVNAILDGYTTKTELADYLERTPHNIQRHLDKICIAVQGLGYRFKRRCCRLPELVEILLEIKEKKYDTRNE